jgi:Fe2+ transport system protein B
LVAKQIPQVGPDLLLNGMALAEVGIGRWPGATLELVAGSRVHEISDHLALSSGIIVELMLPQTDEEVNSEHGSKEPRDPTIP